LIEIQKLRALPGVRLNKIKAACHAVSSSAFGMVLSCCDLKKTLIKIRERRDSLGFRLIKIKGAAWALIFPPGQQRRTYFGFHVAFSFASGPRSGRNGRDEYRIARLGMQEALC